MKNKKYEIQNNTVIVYDKKKNKTERIVTSNVEDILIQENKIDEMKKKIEKYTKFLKEHPDNQLLFKKMIKSILFQSLLTIAASSIGILFSVRFLFQTFHILISYQSLLFMVGIILVKIIKDSKKSYKRYVKSVEKKDAISAALFYLQETLPKEERILYELKENVQMTFVSNENKEKRKVHDKIALMKLKFQLKIWKNLGVKYRKYLKNSHNGYLSVEQRVDLGKQGLQDEKLYENYLREMKRKLEMKKF